MIAPLGKPGEGIGFADQPVVLAVPRPREPADRASSYAVVRFEKAHGPSGVTIVPHDLIRPRAKPTDTSAPAIYSAYSVRRMAQLHQVLSGRRGTASQTSPRATTANGSGRSRSVATAQMPDHDLVAAQFADRHVTTDSASIIVPIVNVKIAPIVVAAMGESRERAQRTRNGGDEWQCSHSNTPPCR